MNDYKLFSNGKALEMPKVFATQSEYINACREYATPYEWLENSMRLTKNGTNVTVYTKEELFQAVFSAILSEKNIPSHILNRIKECGICGSTFVRTHHEKYCCKSCAEQANRVKCLDKYYERKSGK